MRPNREFSARRTSRFREVVAGGLLAACLGGSPCAASATAAPELDPALSHDGVARLTWDVPDTASITLQQAPGIAFDQPTILYRGRDSGTTLTGLADGEYFYRIGIHSDQSGDAQWSAPVRLEVSHHPLSRAWTFFAVGVVVFVATLGLVFLGSRRHRAIGR